MALRVGSAAVSLPLLLLVVWVGDGWFSGLVAVAAAIGAMELCTMHREQGVRASVSVSVSLAVALIALARLLAEVTPDHSVLPPIAAIVAAIGLTRLLWPHLLGLALSRWSLTIAAAAYTGGLLFHAPLLREMDNGLEWMLALLTVTFATDVGAFFVGTAVGKRPMAPSISPGKTWEGAVGGFVSAVASASIAVQLLGLDASVTESMALGGLAGVAGQIGDLAVSRIKRVAGVKDSGRLFPGHGGLFDRMDSIVFNLVVVYYFLLWAV